MILNQRTNNVRRKKLDIKTIFIIILGVLLIISIFRGIKTNQVSNFDLLHEQNENLHKMNDSLIKNNSILQDQRDSIHMELGKKMIELDATNIEIEKLKKLRIGIRNNVKNMTSDSVANGFNDYLDRRR